MALRTAPRRVRQVLLAVSGTSRQDEPCSASSAERPCWPRQPPPRPIRRRPT
jgi:hypothetical protein